MKIFLHTLAVLSYLICMIGSLVGCTDADFLATSTPTPVRTEHIRTLTPTETLSPSLTLTPRPTLVEDEAANVIRELILTNSGCRLPCLWGFTPGETTWRDAEALLLTLKPEIHIVGPSNIIRDAKPYIASTYYVTYKFPEWPRGIGTRVSTIDGVVSAIFIGSETSGSLFELDNLLSEYGKPEEVYLFTLADFPGGEMPFILGVYYPDQYFLSVYEVIALKHNGMLVGCFQETSPKLYVWSADESKYMTNEAILDSIGGSGTQKLNDVTNMDNDSFYDIFKNPTNSTCIETSEEYWP